MLQDKVISGMDSIDAWNDTSIDLVRCAKVKKLCMICRLTCRFKMIKCQIIEHLFSSTVCTT